MVVINNRWCKKKKNWKLLNCENILEILEAYLYNSHLVYTFIWDTTWFNCNEVVIREKKHIQYLLIECKFNEAERIADVSATDAQILILSLDLGIIPDVPQTPAWGHDKCVCVLQMTIIIIKKPDLIPIWGKTSCFVGFYPLYTASYLCTVGTLNPKRSFTSLMYNSAHSLRDVFIWSHGISFNFQAFPLQETEHMSREWGRKR